jgi:hypothetical protein
MRYSKNLLTILLLTIIGSNIVYGSFLNIPETKAQGLQLRVSAAEKPEFENHFFGAQIVQIVIDDPGATDPDESTVGLIVLGATTPRVHLSDGLWYSYVAEDQGFGILMDVMTDGLRDNMIAVSKALNDAGSPVTIGGTPYTITTGTNDSFVAEIEIGPGALPFAELNQADIFTILPAPFFEAAGVINPDLRITTVAEGGGEGDGICDNVVNADAAGLSVGTGAEGDPDCDWPFVKLIGIEELSTMEVRAGTTASVVLIFDDLADSITAGLDRTTDYPLNAEVINNFVDFMWNINPVEEDAVYFALDTASGQNNRILFQPIAGFDPAANGQNFADITNVFTSSPGMEFDERQVLELDPEGVNVLRFAYFLDVSTVGTANPVIGQFVASPFTLISENTRLVSQFDDPDEDGLLGEVEAFVQNAAVATIDPGADDLPVVGMFEGDPNVGVFDNTVENAGGRSTLFTGVNDRVASFDYFDIIASAPMTTHDGFTSVDREIYDSADRAVFTVTDPDQNLRSRISEEPSGRDSSTFIKIGSPFALVNTRNTASTISNPFLDTIERIWVAVPTLATGFGPTTFGINAGPGFNILADANNDSCVDITVGVGVSACAAVGTDSTERFHADATVAGVITQATIDVNNRRLAARFTPPTVFGPWSTVVIDTKLTLDDINDVITINGITGAEILGQVYVDNLQDATADQLESFLVEVGEISPTTGGILGQTVNTGIVSTATYNIRMPKYNLINVDLTDLETLTAFASVIVKIEAVDPTCIPQNVSTGADAFLPQNAFDDDLPSPGVNDECVHASQIVDFGIVEGAPGVDTDAVTMTGSGDEYDTSVNVAGVAGSAAILPWNTLASTVDASGTLIGFDRDRLNASFGVGAFRVLDLERVADANVAVAGDHLQDRVRVTIMLLNSATPPAPANVITAVSQVVVVDIGGLGTIFERAPNPTCGNFGNPCIDPDGAGPLTAVQGMQSTVTNPDAVESTLGNAFSNLVYRLELDEEGSNSSIFTGRADFETFLQFDTVPDVIGDIVLTGDPLKIWMPNRFIPPNRLAAVHLDEDIVQFLREVSATFIYETSNGNIFWDHEWYRPQRRAIMTLEDEDLNRRPDAVERYDFPLSSFISIDLGKNRVNDSCDQTLSTCFFSHVDASLRETGPDTGVFRAQVDMPPRLLLADGTVMNTNRDDLETTYIDLRDRSSVRQEFDATTAVRTGRGSLKIDRAVYSLGAGTGDTGLLGPVMYVEITKGFFTQDPDLRDVFDLTRTVDFSEETGTPNDIRDAFQIKIFNGGGNEPIIYSANPATSIKNGGNAFPFLDKNKNELTRMVESAPSTNMYELEFMIYCPDSIPALQQLLSEPVCTDTIYGIPSFKANSPIEVIFNDPQDDSGTPEEVDAFAVLQGVSARLATDKQEYELGEPVDIMIEEPDFNLDSRKIDEVSFSILDAVTDKFDTEDVERTAGNVCPAAPADFGCIVDSVAELRTNLTVFRETGFNTGVFVAQVEELVETFVDRGEDVELIYTDQTPSGGRTPVRIEYEFQVIEVLPEIVFNKEEYTPFDEFIVSIISPDSNQDPDRIENIRPLVSSSSASIGQQSFPETGPNTGIFEEDFDLTPNTIQFPGDLRAVREDGLTVEFRIDEDTVATKSVFVNYHIGFVMFEKDVFRIIDSGVIRVVDPDANTHPDTIDTIDVRFWSTTDRGGLSVTLRETGDRTGIFEEIVTFTPDEESTGTRLRVTNGDTITIKYTDNTLPAPSALDADSVFTVEVEELFANALVGSTSVPIERIEASEPGLVDQNGIPIEKVEAEQQVLIQMQLKNNQNIMQKFTYIVQIKDSDGIISSLSWISGELPPNDFMLAAQSWIPANKDNYQIEIFVWESVDNPVALSPVKMFSANVL